MPIVRVAQLDQSAGVRSRRSQVRFLSWTPFSALVPQQLQGGFRKPVFVGASPPRGPIFQGRDVTVSISACDADCAGANPVALTTFNLDGPKLIDYPPTIRRAYRPWRKPWRSGFDSRHWSASVRSRHLSI